MSRTTFIITIIGFLGSFLTAQQDGTFAMNLSSDTVLIGNHITLKYSIENLEGEFGRSRFIGL